MGSGRYGQARRGILLVLLAGCALVQPAWALGWRAHHLPGSATALALAGGGAALPGNVSLTALNPAHVWGLRGEAVEFGYLRMFGDLAGFSVKWHGSRRDRPWQLGIRSLVEDGIELRGDVPTADPLADFSARLLSATLLRAWRLGDTYMGVGLTMAYQRMFVYAARGVWLSAGLQGEPLPWLRWSLAVNNLGIGEALYQQKDPLGFRAGAGAALRISPTGSYLTLDLWYDEQEGLIPNLGWQVSKRAVRLMAGVRWVSGAPLLAAGFEMTYHRWSVSLAYGYVERSLGLPHMVSLRRRL